MKMLYRQAELAEERSIILNAIGYAKDPNILSQVCFKSLHSHHYS